MNEETAYRYFISFRESLLNVYSEGEAAAVTDLVSETYTGKRMIALRFADILLGTGEQEELEKVLSRLLKKEPVQYILGFAWFMDERFTVTQAVLIPRPETEELVKEVLVRLSQMHFPVSILDIGTGSGCIPVMLKRSLPGASVFAVDISAGALDVATRNAKQLEAEITFAQHDLLSGQPLFDDQKFDVVVSNPPYIMPEESLQMSEQVLAHEPHQALFVTNRDPLQFYKAIAGYCTTHLKPGGLLAVEVNRNYAREVAVLFESYGMKAVVVKTDASGNERMVTAMK